MFKGFNANEFIFGVELGLLQKEPWLLSIGAINWSPHNSVDPVAIHRSRLLHRTQQTDRRVEFELDRGTR